MRTRLEESARFMNCGGYNTRGRTAQSSCPSGTSRRTSSAAGAIDAKVVVCGDGPERQRLERGFPKVHFLGQVPRKRALEWMAASDVVLSASLEEGAPTVVREARALGVPVVTADTGDVTSWAKRDTGIFVAAPEGEALAQNLRSALGSSGSSDRYSAAAPAPALRLGASG